MGRYGSTPKTPPPIASYSPIAGARVVLLLLATPKG